MGFSVTTLVFAVIGIVASLCTRICFNRGPSSNLFHLTLVLTATICCWMMMNVSLTSSVEDVSPYLSFCSVCPDTADGFGKQKDGKLWPALLSRGNGSIPVGDRISSTDETAHCTYPE
ncbi:hypothetical protein V8G54_036014 [Vigna mungo]|uniref:Uncharacterized protein n=1 Tax=Vigna mungo TaxID=3915 RepID=A0AAQ3MGJ5_VIGMU